MEGNPIEVKRFFDEFFTILVTLAHRSRSPRMARRGFAFDSGLVESWAWGHKSTCDVQAEAEAEFNDQKNLSKTLKISVDFGFASLKQLAGFGHDGT